MAAKDQTRRRGNSSPTSSVKELNLEAQRARGSKTLLENKLLWKIFDEIEKNALENIKNSDVTQNDLREELYRQIMAVRMVEKLLNTWLTRGQNAAFKLQEKQDAR